jgi:NAD(P)-dependent dehydrogenase (short-subunit alcohol dehydrogenase family)
MTVVVIGASSGIGAAITRELLSRGESVVGVGRRDTPEVETSIANFNYLKFDATNSSQRRKLLSSLEGTEVTGWVNNLGRSGWKKIGSIGDAFVDEMYEVNLKSQIMLCSIASQLLVKGGSMVNMASIAGRRGSAQNSVYSSFKFGIVGLTQSLAKELGQRNIRVNCVSPVLIFTEGLRVALAGLDSPAQKLGIEEFLSDFAATQSALNRLPTSEEVAKVVCWLLGGESSAITGQNINVDCGVFPQ